MAITDATAIEAAPLSRTDRRRGDTRRRLMKATYEIISARGVEGLVVQDVTQAADVGYGSFYNHFTSKDAAAAAVIEAASAYADDIHNRLRSHYNDQVEGFAADLRLQLHRSRADKMWGWFVIRIVMSQDKHLRKRVSQHLWDNITAGVAAGHFHHDDIEMAHQTVGGLLLLGTLKLVAEEAPAGYEDRLVKAALQKLHVPEAKIESALRLPLPHLDVAPFLEAVAD